MKVFILFLYLSSFSANGGMTVATAEFSSLEKCQAAERVIKEDFNTTFTQTPKTECIEK